MEDDAYQWWWLYCADTDDNGDDTDDTDDDDDDDKKCGDTFSHISDCEVVMMSSMVMMKWWWWWWWWWRDWLCWCIVNFQLVFSYENNKISKENYLKETYWLLNDSGYFAV